MYYTNLLIRAKHPAKVHIWAGISCQGKTPIVIFDGIMNSAGFIEVLKEGLVPYLAHVNSSPRSCRTTTQSIPQNGLANG